MFKHDISQPTETTTIQESTLLDEYMNDSNQDNLETERLIAELSNTKDCISEWFPNTNEWEIEEIQRSQGCVSAKLASNWSVQRTIRFFRSIDREVGERMFRGKKIFNGRRRTQEFGLENLEGVKEGNELELGLGLHRLIDIANRIYGVSNWMSHVGESKLEKFEILDLTETAEGKEIKQLKCNIVVRTTVKLLLADNTVVEKRGYGYGSNLPREIAFRKCKKESVSDGLKNCFGGLVALLFDYEEKVRKGYYKKYT